MFRRIQMAFVEIAFITPRRNVTEARVGDVSLPPGEPRMTHGEYSDVWPKTSAEASMRTRNSAVSSAEAETRLKGHCAISCGVRSLRIPGLGCIIAWSVSD